MSFDIKKNFAKGTILTAPSPALSGTVITLVPGDGAKFPVHPFNVVVHPAGIEPSAANAEVMRVTNKSGDVLTVLRIQESSTNISVVAGMTVGQYITSKAFTDIETQVDTNTAGLSSLLATVTAQGATITALSAALTALTNSYNSRRFASIFLAVTDDSPKFVEVTAKGPEGATTLSTADNHVT